MLSIFGPVHLRVSRLYIPEFIIIPLNTVYYEIFLQTHPRCSGLAAGWVESCVVWRPAAAGQLSWPLLSSSSDQPALLNKRGERFVWSYNGMKG